MFQKARGGRELMAGDTWRCKYCKEYIKDSKMITHNCREALEALDKKIISYYSDTKVHDKVLVKDIKEAVRRLKDSLVGMNQKYEHAVCKRIDEIFGKGLI